MQHFFYKCNKSVTKCEKIYNIEKKQLCEIYNLDKIEIFNLAGANLDNEADSRISKLNKKEKRQLDDFLGEAGYFFNDESIDDEDKQKFLIALQEMFFRAKLLNKKK